MIEHVCEWELKAYLYVGVPIFGCKIKGCHEKLAVRQAEAMLNEYETLKAATEKLSMKEARDYSEASVVMPKFLQNLLSEYADILEGK